MSVRKKVAGMLIVLSLLAGGAGAGTLLDKVVAVVNKEVITWGELYRAMEFKASESFRALGDSEKKKVYKENEASFLEGMIDTKLQIQAARKLDIGASKEEIAATIGGIRKKYSLGDQEFAESLKREGFTPEEYQKLLAEQIILSKVVNQQVRSKIVVTEREIDEYLAKHKSDGYRIRQIFLKKPEKDEERKTLEATAEEIYRKIQAGEDFSLLAFQYSNDPTAKSGGDLGFVKREHLEKEFLERIDRMRAGDVSEPFRTAGGIHIIRLEEKEEAKSPEEAREIARRKLFDQRFAEEYKNWIKGLREKSFVEVRL